ncbi:MAG: DUF58 domain-containing protein [Actinomycetota bacterium]|nr:DUF58 domain-containing protein [Actinomycetota bacterium]MDP2288863.1 DUF58 domain-containing protein [Actinomycetota bacterium]
MEQAQRSATSITAIPEGLLYRLDWRALKRLSGVRGGDFRTPARGSGIDVTDIRAYEPYDDIRHIDWNVTARLDEPHVREYLEDRDLTAWLLLDRSSSMAFGPADRGKDIVLIELCVALARMLTRGGNRIGAILYDAGIQQVIPAGANRAHVLRLAHQLLQHTPASAQETDLEPLLHQSASMLKRRSLVFLVSDFIVRDGWQRALGSLAQRHDVVVIRIADRREEELPDVGTIWVQDAETGEQLLLDTSDPGFRGQYRQAAMQREIDLGADVRRTGAHLHTVWTDDDLADSLVRMAHTRRGMR